MMFEAEAALIEAARHARLGRFQFEAAIQSVHSQRAVTGETNYAGLRLLYKLLSDHDPSIGAIIGHAAVLVQTGEAGTALGLLDDLPRDRIVAHQPYWVTRAHALRDLARPAETKAAIEIAIGLSDDVAIRRFLHDRFPQ